MQREALTLSTCEDQTAHRVISADYINRLAVELGELGNSLVDTGVATVRKALELGEALTTKKAELDRENPRTWTVWCAENLEFSERHALTYRNLHADRKRVSEGLELGQVTSLRTAMALMSTEERLSTETKTFGATPDEKQETTKLGRVMAKFWSVFHRVPPSKWGDQERSEFLIDLAERERIRKENGWDLPVIDVGVETSNLQNYTHDGSLRTRTQSSNPSH